MGGRRFLAPALLHHPAGDHGAAEALGQQPEVGPGAGRFPAVSVSSRPLAVGRHCAVLCLPPHRFSHSPLIDDDDDDDEEEEAKEPMLNEAFGEQVASGRRGDAPFSAVLYRVIQSQRTENPAKSRTTFISWLTRIQCGHHMQHGRHQRDKKNSSQTRIGISPYHHSESMAAVIRHLRCLSAPLWQPFRTLLLRRTSVTMLQNRRNENEMKCVRSF